MAIPAEMAQWLAMCDGCPVGGDGPYGTRDFPKHLSIGYVLILHPSFRRNQWLPLAGDGCGDYYVIDTNVKRNSYHPIYFIDHEVSDEVPDYVVASNIWAFLYGYLTSELIRSQGADTNWPFDKEETLRWDPGITKFDDLAPLPWDE